MALPVRLLVLVLLVVVIGEPGKLSTLRLLRAELTQDKTALLAFINATQHKRRLRWDGNSTCEWVGVTCNVNRTAVVILRLPGVGLVGTIPSGTLGKLSALRVLSLRSNRLSGPIPADFKGLALLRSLYLQNNLLSGSIHSGLTQLTRLVRLDLSGNSLTGSIPFAINSLTHLTGLFLQNNHLSGNLPSINIGSLVAFNVSYNQLNGSIPRTLEHFPVSSFVGNLDLCGGPLTPCNPFFPSPAPSPATNPVNGSSKKLSKAAKIAIAVAAGVVLLLILLLLLVCLAFRRRRQRARDRAAKGTAAATAARSGEAGMTSSSKDDLSGGVGGSGTASTVATAERNRLVFVGKGGGYSFDLEDLLRASAEVLGKGSVGTSYKAVLEEGTTVVVKRLKDVAVPKREFEVHIESLGKVEHDNLLPLRAYYYSKDEKLLVFDYLPAGSLSSLLHGSRGSGRTPLDWDSRMRIALSAGRGLSHLHTAAQVVHGNVKASNVLLRTDLDSAALSDFGLHPLFGTTAPPNRVAGYRAPEVLETRRPTFKSDVYSFGVLLLELLTGKAPNQASLGEDGIDLPRWVQSVVREEWTAEVFDVELMRYPNIEEEMVQLLQVAMACVAVVPDTRPDLPDVVRMMEEIVSRTESNDEGRRVGGSGGPSPPPTTTP
ncbi:inactive receptor kinase [Musa troglodytarum]|uniref:Inactive receptor kinase n=1 Tax=Musa troglodytarum TaxID=320322 RepID=A0A9E7FRJ6_9LILI|nr:inactive receptor kinase [Musa troglodytarum]